VKCRRKGTNKHFTLKQNRLSRADLDGCFRSYTYAEIIARDKASLDIFWLRDESLEDSSKLPDPHILAAEIADELRTSLEQIEDILGDLTERARLHSGAGTVDG
jgi:type I restriction enzyme M protein